MMEYLLAKESEEELLRLMRIVRSRGLEGENGTWEDFLKVYDPQMGHSHTCTSFRGSRALIEFLTTLKKKEDVQLILRWLMSPGRVLAHILSREYSERDLILLEYPGHNRVMAELLSREVFFSKRTNFPRLVQMTLSRDDQPLDYYLSPFNTEDWVVTGIGRNKQLLRPVIDIVAVSCAIVLCEDGSEAAVRVALVNSDLQVILDEFVKPNQPVVDYKTAVTGLTAQDLENAETLSVPDIQERLRMLLSQDTIMVGHFLNKDLTALKMDHTRKIDTSLVFTYDYSGEPPRPFLRSNRYFTCTEDGSYKPKRPSLSYLCKSIMGLQAQEPPLPNACVHNAESAMRLVLAIERNNRIKTSIPLTEEMLEAEKSRLFIDSEEKNASSKTHKRELEAETSYPEEKNVVSKKQKREANSEETRERQRRKDKRKRRTHGKPSFKKSSINSKLKMRRSKPLMVLNTTACLMP